MEICTKCKKEKSKAFEIILFPGANPYIDRSLKSLDDMLIDGEVGEEIKINIIAMCEDEFTHLPEWDGP